MAQALKDQYGPHIPQRIAAAIGAVHPAFDTALFLADALNGYEALDLMARGRHIAQALQRHLQCPFPEAAAILLAAIDAPGPKGEGSLAPFFYLPHTCFVALYGLDHFDAAMQAQYRLTQCFTAEFSIRPFLLQHPERTLAQLRGWAGDRNEHVRRLVSEGTRPRLPWAARLPAFIADPKPVLALLELLKDDPSPYVRRSVANNLNDIGKDHPEVLVDLARRWMRDAGPERRALLAHALRSLLKRGHRGALGVLGYVDEATVELDRIRIEPTHPRRGDTLTIGFELHNRTGAAQQLCADLRVHYVKASGRTSIKVFRLRQLELPARAQLRLTKTISLRDMTTRRHYPGRHKVEALLNGRVLELGDFELV
jgi:3-methyladenine DNA glycosylase AlkC